MNVLHVIPSIAARYGGPSAAVRGMARAVAALGSSVTVATTNADGPAAADVPLDRVALEDGVHYRYFARSIPGEWKFSWSLTRWLFAHVSEFDVVHVHSLFSYATIPACRAAERAGVPYVLRPLGTLGAHSLSLRAWKKRPYLALVERRHLNHAAAIHVTSQAEAEALDALGYGSRACIVPLGVDVVEPAESAPRLPLEGPLRLLFLSRLDPGKGLDLLLDALATPTVRRAAWQLTIAGSGSADYEARLRRRVAEAGMESRVAFVGHVGGEEKRQLLATSDVFVLPSHHENFGIAVAEALAAGLPVIVSDQVGIAPDVAASGAGLVVPLAAEPLGEAVLAMAGDPTARAGMAVAAGAVARSKFSWRRAGLELEALYRAVQHGGASNAA